jgi:hypothetical protein
MYLRSTRKHHCLDTIASPQHSFNAVAPSGPHTLTHLLNQHACIRRLFTSGNLLLALLLSVGSSLDAAKSNSGTAALTLTASAPGVAAAQKLSITSNQPATFTLSGPGLCTGCGVAGVYSVVYTAPPSVQPQSTMLGCPVAPNDSVFNTPVDSLPVHAKNSMWLNGSSGLPFSFQPSWGISAAGAATPKRVLHSYYGEYINSVPWPTFNSMKRENGNYLGSTNFAAPDHHVMTVDTSDCSFYESYGDKLNDATTLCQDGVTTGCNVSSVITYSWSNYTVPPAGGTDAAGLPLAPLVVHLQEIKSGVINHAMRFTSALGYVQGDANWGVPLLWPAATSNGCPTSVCFNAPIIGARLQLKSDFDISSFSPTAQVLLRAMQKYGMILADIGTSNAITTTSDLTTDPAAMAALSEIYNAGITMLKDMEFVDESSLQAAAGSYRVCPLKTACVAGVNSYQAPLDQVTITATNGSSTATMPIALQGVSIGTSLEPDVLVMAGSYTWKIETWVNGSPNQPLQWTLLSGVGSITPDGVYSPPLNTDIGASAVLHAVAAADRAATLNLYLTIAPAGAIRIDTGATGNTVDGEGNLWLGNQQPEGYVVQYNDNYPGWTTTSYLKKQYETGVYTYGNDLTYPNIVVPNGDYEVSWLLGLNSQCGTTPCGSYLKTPLDMYVYAPVHLESQNQIGHFAYNWLAPIGYVSAAPSPIVSIPAKVTNNVLYASLRTVSNDVAPFDAPGAGRIKAAILAGIIVIRAPTRPNWTIDTRQQHIISAGETLLPFRVVDWSTGRNDPVWTVTGKGATITTTTDATGAVVGTLTLASGTLMSGQPITVTASDGTYSASVVVYAAGGLLSK